VVPLLAASVACGAASSQQVSSTGSVRLAQDACQPGELRALFRGFQSSKGALAGAVVVTTSGSRACWVGGTPRNVSLLDDGGDTLSVNVKPLPASSGSETVVLSPGVPLPTFGAPPSHGSAWLSVTWTNWCSDASPTIGSVLIVLPRGGSIPAPVDAAAAGWAAGPPSPRCANPKTGSTLSFGRFQPALG
jgi:hypothetical protein